MLRHGDSLCSILTLLTRLPSNLCRDCVDIDESGLKCYPNDRPCTTVDGAAGHCNPDTTTCAA